MPRIVNPGDLRTGHGKAAPDENVLRPSLTGAGLAGPGPNIGQPVTPVGSMYGGPLVGEGFASHIQDPKGAHAASAIEHDGHPDILISGNVEGALDELIGVVTKRPPYLGQWSLGTSFSGITDWGYLKLRDDSLDNYPLSAPPPLANLPVGHSATNVFPYYFSAPGPAQDSEFTNNGGDPRTDHLWNSGISPLVQPGMGYGRCHIGGFTREGDVGPAPKEVMRTARLYPRPTGIDPDTGLPYRVPVTFSGSLFPADRGVLALFHFPASDRADMQAEFLGQPLITDETVVGGPQGRVVAALLLGNGLLGDKCNSITPCTEQHLCDGDPGGIFTVGLNVVDKYDPFAFPGRATGQYDLQEIHLGQDSFSNDLIAPWNDLDGDTVTGAVRTSAATVPAPGQVRLGTDPDAGETPVNYGIPILGGTADYFDVAPTPQLGSLGFAIKGDSLILSSNFFRYRVPVLKDYSPTTGLKWTPRGDAGITTQEVSRFFEMASPASTDYPDGDPATTPLRSAGFYESGFDEDYWVWQVARYRHTFLMPSIEGVGLREEVGSYWLVHFKSEKDFEKFARDGIFPWDVADGYEVYGSSLAGSPPVHIEEDKNVVNEWPQATPPVSPDGPAPAFGYASNPYHLLRSTILLDPDGTALPAVSANTYGWSSVSIPGAEAIMWVSGVAYHTPRLADTGATSFQFDSLSLILDPGFWTSYRTNQQDLTADDTVAPAILASVNPLFLNMAPWAYGTAGIQPISLTVPTGVPTVGVIPSTKYLGTHRIEFPFEYLGSNAGGVFSNANGPLDADTLDFSIPDIIEMVGDVSTPAFTRNATLRAYLRRPLNHTADEAATLPFAADDGHGQVLLPTDLKTVLYHSSKFSKNIPANGIFGNYVVAAIGAPPNTSYSELTSAAKDTGEVFLDEVYRLIPSFSATLIGFGGNPYTAAAIDSLVGPGMQGWAGGPIEVPVRANLAQAPWDTVSWLLMENHLADLTAGGPDVLEGLQVAGLPDRNPPQSAAVQVPFPSCGMLLYPQEDYTAMSPESGVHFAGAQPDYSVAVGSRKYVRAFDAAFIHGAVGYPLTPAGTSTVVFRLDGITLEDIGFLAPGPGGMTDNRVALSLKVPGVTTWMDMGRSDGAGPSKQDMFQDGAGCQVIGNETYNFRDPVTGYVGCYVKVNVGPVATLFASTGTWALYTAGTTVGEAPLLVKVDMPAGSVDYDLSHRFVGGVFEVPEKPGADPQLVRGLIGIKVVHPTDTLIAP